MHYELLYPGAFGTLKVQLGEGESIKTQTGAMIAMSDTLDIEGKMDGGLLKSLGRVLSGETFMLRSVVARRGPGEVLLAHEIPGEIHPLELDGSTSYLLQKDGFFAGTADLEVASKVQNLIKGLISGEGFFIVRVSGRGTLFVSSYGAIHPVDLADGQEMIIDNAHLVAWPETMAYTIQKAAAGLLSTLTTGEGLVCRFRGPGRVLIQTRNPGGFGNWVRQFVPAK